MSPKIVASKLIALNTVLQDLRPHVIASRAEQENAHYEIERQVQLCVEFCVAIARRLLTLRSLAVPESNRDVFIALRNQKLISRHLADDLCRAASLRNLLVHEYEGLDYDIFFSGLKQGYKAFVAFAARASALVA